MDLLEFFHMGGYAFYVWSAYGLAVLLFFLNILLPRARHRRLLNEIDALRRREGRRQP